MGGGVQGPACARAAEVAASLPFTAALEFICHSLSEFTEHQWAKRRQQRNKNLPVKQPVMLIRYVICLTCCHNNNNNIIITIIIIITITCCSGSCTCNTHFLFCEQTSASSLTSEYERSVDCFDYIASWAALSSLLFSSPRSVHLRGRVPTNPAGGVELSGARSRTETVRQGVQMGHRYDSWD